MKSNLVSVRTNDSLTRSTSRKTLDTVLNVATNAELAEYFAGRAKLDPGTVWDGLVKPLLDALDPRTRDELLQRVGEYEKPVAKPHPSDPATVRNGDTTRKKVADGILGDLIDNRSFGDKWNDDLRKQFNQPSLKA